MVPSLTLPLPTVVKGLFEHLAVRLDIMSSTIRNLGLALGAAAFMAPVEAQLYDKVIQTSLGPVQGYQYFTNQTELEYYFGVSSSNVANFLGMLHTYHPIGMTGALQN